MRIVLSNTGAFGDINPLIAIALKQMARTGLEHSFLLGKSLWAKEDAFTTPVSECSGQPSGAEKPSVRCKAYLDANEKAVTQWEQEHRFHIFEARW